ncbi:MAG: ThiF family adenylyltransferase [gamma proteobacterium symbiont of Lucinoma myriamae]|nr:ThiF family adenylyltransferase [gamma proteobacterium symbiont of Lucinoma myriamae]MCU7831613.1 ThiF family adenylyltransferase [gamma proteobacterium symbiont of Lucinoma myriamae]
MDYNYHEAVSRNIGWISEWEQLSLRTKKIAIAGMGGVGGAHLIALSRLGIGQFHIADLDQFEVANFNRQYGATMDTIGQEKVDILAQQAKEINPEVAIKTFSKGINEANIDEFLDGVDVFVDGFDFFVLGIRRKVFKRCQELGIPAVTAAPIGMGTAYLCFNPQGMSFEDYFNFEGLKQSEQYINFVMGLAPKAFHRHYLIDPTRLDLVNKRGPSTVMGINLCAGVIATEVLKILTGRGKVYYAPFYQAFDAYQCQWTRGKLRHGNKVFLQKLKCKIGYKVSQQVSTQSVSPDEIFKPKTAIEEIINIARWAPSGDNTQPWRFEILDDEHFLIHAHDTRDWCVYDLDGRASQIAVGALLETLSIVAVSMGIKATFSRQDNSPEDRPVIEVTLENTSRQSYHPLRSPIEMRTTQRRAFSSRPLTCEQKKLLGNVLGEGYQVIWLEGWKNKWRMAWLLFKNAHIRLTIKEAYKVHKQIIQWDAQFSEDKIPDQAVGLDPVTLKLMKWTMHSWDRVQMLNQYFAGTWLPRIQLDLLPALRCAAHFVIVADQPLKNIDDYIDGGRALQRFWLTATNLGLQFQPEMTPLIFSRYVMMSENFTQDNKANQNARILATELENILGNQFNDNRVFMGRLGVGSRTVSRSARQTVDKLKV